MISIWEKNSFLKYDFIIIGAGITGLSSAISVKEINPTASILVLEKGVLPTGASTKNAGFACFGSPTEILDDYEKFGKDAALSLIEDRIKGLEILKKRIGEKILDLKYDGGYELISDPNDPVMDQLESLNKELKHIFKGTVFYDATEKIKTLGFSRVSHLIFTPHEGQLDSGKMMKALWQKATSMGIVILTGCRVRSVTRLENHAEVLMEKLRFQGKKVIICTNAFAKELVPHVGVNPGRGIVLITAPIAKLPFKGSFHFGKGFYYFRNFENRIIFGGGRNIDLEREETLTFEVNKKILDDLTEKLRTIILPCQNFEIEMTWAGIMGFGITKQPEVKMLSENLAVAVGLGGMGIALSSLIGQKVALLVNRI